VVGHYFGLFVNAHRFTVNDALFANVISVFYLLNR